MDGQHGQLRSAGRHDRRDRLLRRIGQPLYGQGVRRFRPALRIPLPTQGRQQRHRHPYADGRGRRLSRHGNPDSRPRCADLQEPAHLPAARLRLRHHPGAGTRRVRRSGDVEYDGDTRRGRPHYGHGQRPCDPRRRYPPSLQGTQRLGGRLEEESLYRGRQEPSRTLQ